MSLEDYKDQAMKHYFNTGLYDQLSGDEQDDMEHLIMAINVATGDIEDLEPEQSVGAISEESLRAVIERQFPEL